MNRIKRVSHFFRVLFQFLLVALPLTLIYAWATSPESIVLLGGMIDISFIPQAYHHNAIRTVLAHGSQSAIQIQDGIMHPLSSLERLMGFGLSAIPMTIELYIIYSLIKLFKLYELGEIFSIKNVRYIRNIGYALLIGQLINPFYEALMGIVLTLHNPPGHRYAMISFHQTNIGIIFTGLLVILISWIMAEGYKLREDQQLTI